MKKQQRMNKSRGHEQINGIVLWGVFSITSCSGVKIGGMAQVRSAPITTTMRAHVGSFCHDVPASLVGEAAGSPQPSRTILAVVAGVQQLQETLCVCNQVPA